MFVVVAACAAPIRGIDSLVRSADNGHLNGCFENDNIKFIIIMSNNEDPFGS